KLLVRMITGSNLIAAYDDFGYYFLQDNLILPKQLDIKYILAIINSRLFSFISKNIASNIAVTQSILKDLPIKVANDSQLKFVVGLVDKMLSLNKELRETPENSDKWNFLKSEIEKTDHKIDAKVYKLYGLTDDEVKIIEDDGK
ncbi:MAG: N-6 DNA methylase, partial [Parcubacteria group bacterium Gr01-1014_73]